jgi:hypothetical protein
MRQAFKSATLGVLGACLLSGTLAWAEGTPTNGRERFFLKRQNCTWTQEMGKAIYECLKANNGFNAHWCHNEALDQFCPADDSAVPQPAAETIKDKG